ncbi:MAG: Coenzyme F420 hydrogenase/dehydrogenase, beta subunit C-terminal domain, partial [Clostridia bacterium]|nr:Coenzyme F420 hydrogenase/dehydrogenase, beta subunit C-terminal domain [Clostridia bacterium]
PCQVAGLYALLDGRRPENLLTVDFVCHGVPSPGVFASYLQWLRRRHGDEIVSYTFRDKRLGWKNFSAAARFAGGAEHTGTQTEDPFLRGFLQNLYLRPSCHSCTALRYGAHAADLTIADLWGAQEFFPEWDDDRGLSLVFANTKKGREALDACPELERRVIADAGRMARANPSIFAPAPAHAHRRRFFKAFRRKGFSDRLIESCLRENRAEKALRRLRHAPAGILRRVKRLTGR